MMYRQEEKKRAYYIANKEKLSKKARERYLKNRGKILKRVKERYIRKAEELKIYRKEYYKLNKKYVVQRQNKWRLKNKEKIKKIQERYRQKHKNEIKKYNKNYINLNRIKRNEIKNKWRKNNPQKIKEEKLKARFNISLLDYENLIKTQDNKCGICRETFNISHPNISQYPCIDHNHITKNIRGILCRKCNSGLGGFKDRSDLLIKALQWLEGKTKFKDETNVTIPYKKRYDLKRIYNISEKEFIELLTRQAGFCGICNTKLDFKKTAINIDHCHKTKKIRGILCGQCNRSLGLFKDNPNIIRNALEWLRKDLKNEDG